MKKLLIIGIMCFALQSCITVQNYPDSAKLNRTTAPLPAEPHLILGQQLSFLGCNPDKIYLVIGYKATLDSPTEKDWYDQDYIVFMYTNDLNDIKQGSVHKNAIIKQ